MAISSINPYNYYNSALYTGANPYASGYSGLFTLGGAAGSAGTEATSALDSFYQSLNPSVQFNKSIHQYVADIKQGAKDVSSAWKGLSSAYGSQSAYRTKSAASANEDALVATGGAANAKAFDVQVVQLASGQVNQGNALTTTKAAENLGYHQMQIDMGGKSHSVSFSVNQGDSNHTMLQKMAEAINAKGIGLKAAIQQKDGASTLSVTADSGGEFAIRDVMGSAAASTGIDTMLNPSQEAQYRIDGGALQTSASNTVKLSNGVTLNFKEASDAQVRVSFQSNTAGVVDKALDLVEGYNALLSAAEQNAGARGADRLTRELSGIARTYASSLSRIGISVDANGYLTLQKEAAEKAAQDGRMESFFTGNSGASFGFGNRLSRVAESITRSPSQYVAGVAFNQTLASGATDWQNSGWIFDALV